MQSLIPPVEPQMALPEDEGLPGLPLLFDSEWVWGELSSRFGATDDPPQRIRCRNFTYRPGIRALLNYVAEWHQGNWITEDQFAIEITADGKERFFQYPDDPYLPGLEQAASPIEAHDLLAKHVMTRPRRLRVELVRYRPASRAVLRHIAGWGRAGKTTFFVRVMRPERVGRLLAAAGLAEQSGFALPRLVGQWEEGGVIWLNAIPGETLRTWIRKGTAPDSAPVLDGLENLWSTSPEAEGPKGLDLLGSFRMTDRILSHVLRDHDAAGVLEHVTDVLRPFSEAWRPTAIAHNDFYDDQMIIMPDGRLGLVDFEETGPGDPLLDVGNMLAHLRWMSRFGVSPQSCDTYRNQVRSEAIRRFGWDSQDLALREAFALFRLSSNPFRQLHPEWAARTEKGLTLAAEALTEAA